MKKLLSFLSFLFVILSFAQSPYITITVAKDGSGDFTTIQSAINSIRDLGPAEALIKVKSGIYNEKVVIPSSKHLIRIEGENKDCTIINNDDFSGKQNPLTKEKLNTFNSYTFLVAGDNIKISNLTI